MDQLLIGSQPLAGVWGTERFGLACVEVLQAVEVRGFLFLPFCIKQLGLHKTRGVRKQERCQERVVGGSWGG